MLLVLLALVGISVVLTIANWRLGTFCWMLIAIVQDPIRKVTPETPAYMSLTFLPIYVLTFVSLTLRKNALGEFRARFGELSSWFVLFVASLLFSFVQTMSYGTQAAPIGLLGVFSYVGGVPALLVGYFFIRHNYDELDRYLMAFVFLTSVMIIGVPLEHAGVEFKLPWLGMIGSDVEWRRWYNDTDWVAMISGFYRSPEILGWHAMTMVCMSVYLIMRRPQMAWLWLATASWGTYAVMMSGRRKMLMMIFVFLGVFLWSVGRRKRGYVIAGVIASTLVLGPILALTVDRLYLKSFESGWAKASSKATEKGIAGPLWLLQLVGPFGYGIGTKTQGSQHLEQLVRTPLVEGGLEKLLVELGYVGTICALCLTFVLLSTAFRGLKRAWDMTIASHAPAFCFSLIFANGTAFLVAFQFFGDPYVVTSTGFLMGLLLSVQRFPVRRHVPMPTPVIGARQTALARPEIPGKL